MDGFGALPVGNAPQLSGPTETAAGRDERTEGAAREFEAAFIRQMLQHAGVAEAFTGEGGATTDAFSGFLLDHLAEDLSAKGGFGLAERFYTALRQEG